MASSELPVFSVRGEFEKALARGPVVLSSPTGSGKSTEVPRWCEGRVLVVEPRRIACRTLAARVADLERTTLGGDVGYVVRDERVLSSATRIVFATPGMALRDRALLASARTVVLDEFHERSLETDLLLALLLRSGAGADAGGAWAPGERALVVMSATLEGERVAQHVGGAHVTAEGRAFPVEIRHHAGSEILPHPGDLAARVRAALALARSDPGDVLVFLPGKAEIEACALALQGEPVTLVPLHGSLELGEQRRAFERAPCRKVILATNVAETSLTIPGVGVVIDAGLVRQTRYHDGRGFLALGPIADDSAAQRAGRAGRTAPGVAIRLWSAAARLERTTLPEIHRESLVPLVLAAAAWGERPEDLRLLDPPRAPALLAARADLAAWDALEGERGLSRGGAELFALPVEPGHARLLGTARREGVVADAIDLVAALSVGRPLFVAPSSREGASDDLRAAGCDATATIRAVREARPGDEGISSFVLAEARRARARLRRLEGLADQAPAPAPIDREALVRAAIAADPRCVHVARTRGRDTFFSNGGTEIELARESAVARVRAVEALVVLDTRAFGKGATERVLVTCGMAIPLMAIARAGLGRDRVGAVSLEGKRVLTTIERVFAKRVVETREEPPTGALAREAIATLLERGSLWRDTIRTTRERLERSALAEKLASLGRPLGASSIGGSLLAAEPALDLAAWLRARIESLGVESGDDLALLSASDFLAPELPYEVREALDRELPATVSVGDATYRAEYDLDRSQVLLQMVKGSRTEPPPLSYLPKFPGLRICVTSARGLAVLRERGR